jgi:hypothetical protein
MDTSNYRFRVLKPLAEKLGISQVEIPDPAPHDGNPGPKDGVREGHQGAPAALAAGYYCERVNAAGAGGRTRDCRLDVLDASERKGRENVS